ncbi:MAG TPA: hypothetical protein PLH92_06080 [Mycobacterium sp.]|nr:hypothetical protein [Mycobacterium sp.]
MPGSAVSPVVSAAAAFAVFDDEPNSRRDTANAVHINGATAGPSPVPPVANQDNRFDPRALTPVDAVARVAAAGEATGAEAASATGDTTAGASLPTGAADSTGAAATTGRATVASSGASLPTAGVGTLTGASLLTCGVRDAAGADAPLRGDALLLVVSFDDDTAPPRPERRGEVVFVEPADDDDEASVLEPAEPAVSAKATGIDATAEPTPRAMASAPTRPT